MSEISTRLDYALDLAREVSGLILGFYQAENLPVERKRDSSPVTAADRGAEERIREGLAARFPGDAIRGEEFGEQGGTTGFRWILDPV
ncbi:MAG: inositol monophosphatase family protein, partial [Planctomycetaceae bacterium]